MTLDLNLYSQAELAIKLYSSSRNFSRKLLGDLQIQAFSTPIFDNIGFPTTISSPLELWRYQDTMQDCRSDMYIRFLGNKLLPEELQSFLILSDYLLDFSKRLGSPYPNRSINCLLSSLFDTRLHNAFVKYCFPKLLSTDTFNVLEVGPGSGLNALHLFLQSSNSFVQDYFALEATQSFSIYQQILWQDFLNLRRTFGASSNWASHICPFDFANLRYSIEYANISIVHIHHAFRELKPEVRDLIFARLNDLWRDKPGVVIMDSQFDTPELRQHAIKFDFNYHIPTHPNSPNWWSGTSDHERTQGLIGMCPAFITKNIALSNDELAMMSAYLVGDSSLDSSLVFNDFILDDYIPLHPSFSSVNDSFRNFLR